MPETVPGVSHVQLARTDITTMTHFHKVVIKLFVHKISANDTVTCPFVHKVHLVSLRNDIVADDKLPALSLKAGNMKKRLFSLTFSGL